MAEALLEFAFKKLVSLVETEFATFSGIKQKAEHLSNSLDLIRACLEDAEEKQFTDRSIMVWLQQLRDAAYALEDILDACSAAVSVQHGWFSSFNPNNIMLRLRVGHKLKEMIERLDQIAEAKNKFVLTEHVREGPTEVAEWRQTSSTIVNPHVYGRDEDRENAVEFLLSRTQGSDSFSIYSIVGFGGLGKTTLAQMVYNDHRVSNHFDLKIWICVSENFFVQSILCSIMESIMKQKCDKLDLDVMEQKLKELLQSKRYLLVLDDVWKESTELKSGLSQDKWDKLKSVMSCGSNGSFVLVSTRDKDVAAIMGASQIHNLSVLSEEDCWSLFKQRAFGPGREAREELVAIGKDIVKKCGGSPLAALALGGVMRSRRGVKEWLEVKESNLWALSDENSILPVLRLSYLYLTPTLKQCFAFCAIFPKDAEIEKQDLIHLWMSNEFISSRENLDVEEVGNMIWNELYQKSFFQDVRTDDYTGIIYFKMHDQIHDLAQSISKEECLCLEKRTSTDLPKSTHHININCYLGDGDELFKKVESLRTFYQPEQGYDDVRFPSQGSLRVLCTSPHNISSLGNLIHLQYLRLDCCWIKTLPNSIYSLRKLKVLKLRYLNELCSLPKHLTRLEKLRHLVIGHCPKLCCMFPNIHKLSQMRTLSLYIVKREAGYSLKELGELNLGGQLRIEGLENVGSSFEAQEANLKGKQDLRNLELSWGPWRHTTMSDATNDGPVLEALQPHSNLKVLRIRGYGGQDWPSWMGNKSLLNNLVFLKLDRCKNSSQPPRLGRLPSLKKLKIYYVDNVQYLDDGEYYDGVEVQAFPSLEELKVSWSGNMERLLKVERGNMFPRLSDLHIVGCPKLQLPCLPSVKRLYLKYCSNELQLRSISSLNGLEHLSFYDVESFPEGMTDNLSCLKSLRIEYCHKLECLPEQCLEGLCSLRTLEIVSCPRLRSLPDGVRHLISLEDLTISYCPELRSLPEGVRHLNSLQKLNIEECTTLKERCKEGTGEDWHKISHIPNVTLGRMLSYSQLVPLPYDANKN